MCLETHAQAYEAAIARAVQRKAAADGAAHVLDLGTGTGLLALMAARAGAASVVACDLLAPLVAAARQAWALHFLPCVTVRARCVQDFNREPAWSHMPSLLAAALCSRIRAPLITDISIRRKHCEARSCYK